MLLVDPTNRSITRSEIIAANRQMETRGSKNRERERRRLIIAESVNLNVVIDTIYRYGVGEDQVLGMKHNGD